MKSRLLARIASLESSIGIVGLGYVGLPLALRFAEAGFRVVGMDTDAAKMELIRRGATYLPHLPSERIRNVVEASRLVPTTTFDAVESLDAIILCVPTPLDGNLEPDLSYITGSMDSVAPGLRSGQLVSLESTTYPGTTEEVIAPYLANRGLTVGEDAFLVFSPEREDPGNAVYHTGTIPKLLGGVTENCTEVGLALYREAIERVIPVSSARVAETAKLLENIYRSVNIGLANEMKLICDRMGIDVWEVIDAAATKPFGFTPFYPGPGLGGHCIPIDPFYLSWKARQFGVEARFIELAGQINRSMPDYVIEKTVAAIEERGGTLAGSNVLILGVAYKKNIGDVRESPAVEIIQGLEALGARVAFSDPWVPKLPLMRRADVRRESVELTPAALEASDAVILVTDHDGVDYALVADRAKLVIDTRGVLRGSRANVVPS